ncbi:MAG TPA: hypothetical protein VFL97_04575 [Nitrococcus sp.]|nr:hypothetical protein [Nitrococcus sp.]
MAIENVTPTSTHHHTTDRFAKAAHDVVDRVAARGARAEERLRRSGDHYSGQSRQAMDWMTTYIYDHPYASVGMALMGGYVIARMLRSR